MRYFAYQTDNIIWLWIFITPQYYDTFILDTAISFELAIILIYEAAPSSDQKKYFLIGGENVCVGILRRVRGLKKFSHKSVNYKDFGPKTTTLESGLLFSQPEGYKNCIESNGIHRFYSKKLVAER